MEVRNVVREFLTTTFLYAKPDRVLGDTESLLGTGVVDSMGVVEVMDFLEDTFGITIPEADITTENFGTIDAIVRYVEAKQ